MYSDKSQFVLGDFRSYDYVAAGLMSYIVFAVVLFRMLDGHVDVAYEIMWGCNVGMILASWGLLQRRTALVGTAVALVCLDQVLWYFDIAWRLLSPKKSWPIGVAAYLEDPMVAWLKKLTCVHHLFFLPVCFWALWGKCVPFCCWFMEVLLAFLLAFYCRYTTTKWVARDRPEPTSRAPGHEGHQHNDAGVGHNVLGHKDDPKRLYCNVNMSHGMWRDVKIKWLHRFNDSSAVVYLPFLTASLNIAVLPLFIVIRFLICLTA